jgi:acetyl coenzyme A synthetase (ADP forming), alpha domain
MQTPTFPTAEQNREAAYRPLDAFFQPKSVAVIGATDTAGSVGRTVLWNLINSPFGGTVYPVNPKRAQVLGIRAYPSIRDLPEVVDLAVVVTPAKTVPGVISDCADIGVKSAIIISAGFKEIGPEGAALEQEVLKQAQRGNMRIIGPNCLGLMAPRTGLNATFASTIARPGNVGFISQSGALCTSVLDWSLEAQVGFSAFVSIGSMLDVSWGDLIDYLGNDPHTNSIVIYMETIGNARSFLSAAREVALRKPIIVIKAGRTAAAAKAAASHTGSLAGSDAVLDAAFKRCGVLRVDSITDLFSMADVLGKQPRPQGPRLSIVTNAGGPGVLATDALISTGGELAPVSEATMEELNKLLPPQWSHNNPIDVLGDASPSRYAEACKIAAADPESDGLLVVLTPQAMTDPTQTAAQVVEALKDSKKPVLASWMGGPDVAAGVSILNRANIPTFDYPDTAAKTFSAMWQYSENLRSLYETPSLEGDIDYDRAEVASILDEAQAQGRTILTEEESKRVLQAYGIPTVSTLIAQDVEEAILAADSIGYPVVLKLLSKTITHKTDVGGVRLNLKNSKAVREAYQQIENSVTNLVGREHFEGVTVQPMIRGEGYEIILGSSLDPQFGPVLLFGTGGQLVEVYKDSALGLPPLTTTLAGQMIDATKIGHALKGVRGRAPIDRNALELLLVRFSQLVVEQPRIKEIDINPLFASPEQLIAMDGRVILHSADEDPKLHPNPAIRPYPTQYVEAWKLEDGTPVTIRPIRPEDEPLMVNFHKSISEESVRFRYLSHVAIEERITHERLAQMCFIDYDRAMALVVDKPASDGEERQILGVGRMTRRVDTKDAEFAIVVSDAYQRLGIGSELLQRLVTIARAEGLQRLVAELLPDNHAMIKLTKELGFSQEEINGRVHVSLEL